MKLGYCLSSYSIADLLDLLVAARGESIRLIVGYQPVLIIKGQEFGVEGPDLVEEDAAALLRSVANTRQMRDFRKRATTEIIHAFKGSRFLVRAIFAFDEFRLDIHALRT